ncbi:MAG: hypothetical protein ACI841_003242, partial [Planctomycetota bacterium]
QSCSCLRCFHREVSDPAIASNEVALNYAYVLHARDRLNFGIEALTCFLKVELLGARMLIGYA